jgi:mannan endo-1,4-beta-mannosidase
MKSRLAMFLAVALAAAAVGVAASRLAQSSPSPPPAAHAILTPQLAAYLGVFEPGAPPNYGVIASFGQMAGRQPNLVGYYSGWAQPFDTSYAQTIREHGVSPFVQIDPTDASISAIASGTYDDYLRSYAESVRNFRHAVVIGFGHEMNAPWSSWGYKHVPAATFVAAWRHIVTLFREQGADNVTWLWTLEADQSGTGPVASWWPGAQYVTWIGIDGYYYRSSDTFRSVFGQTITQVRAFTSKPVLLSETAVGPDAGQFAKIQDLFHGMAAYKTLGLVWFDKTQHGGIFRQDWRIEDNLQAQISFRLGVRDELTPYRPAS